MAKRHIYLICCCFGGRFPIKHCKATTTTITAVSLSLPLSHSCCYCCLVLARSFGAVVVAAANYCCLHLLYFCHTNKQTNTHTHTRSHTMLHVACALLLLLLLLSLLAAPHALPLTLPKAPYQLTNGIGIGIVNKCSALALFVTRMLSSRHRVLASFCSKYALDSHFSRRQPILELFGGRVWPSGAAGCTSTAASLKLPKISVWRNGVAWCLVTTLERSHWKRKLNAFSQDRNQSKA